MKQINFPLFLLLFLMNYSVCFAAFPIKKTTLQTSSSFLSGSPENNHSNISFGGGDVQEYHKAIKPKQKEIALLLSFPLGVFGLHDFYLSQKKGATGHLVLLGVSLLIAAIFIATGALASSASIGMIFMAVLLVSGMWEIALVWSFVDFFRIIFNGLKPISGHWG